MTERNTETKKRQNETTSQTFCPRFDFIRREDEFIMIIMSIMYVELQGTDALDYQWKMVEEALATCTCTNLLFWNMNKK